MSFDNRTSYLLPAITKANANTPLYGPASNNPPSTAPTTPLFLTNTSNSVTVYFNAALVTGTPKPTFSILWGPPGGPYNTSVIAGNFSGSIYFATISGLTANEEIQCVSVATNSGGSKQSLVSQIFSAATGEPVPPNLPPGVPFTVQGSPPANSITILTNAAGVTGDPTPIISFLYGTTTTPTTPITGFQVFPNGSLYVAVVGGLTASTAYYFQSVATNSAGSETSVVSAPITTGTGSGTPPNQPPTVPVVSGTPTSNSITVTVDAAGITGTPPPTISLIYGPVITPNIPLAATLVSGTTYTATATGLLASTPYYFRSIADNGNTPSQISAVSAAISTAAATPLPPLATIVVLPFLLQGPRFGSTAPWAGIDYYIATPATGATYSVGGTSAQGQQLFGSMYAGTVGSAGDVSGGAVPPVPYAGACTADQVFNANFGATSDAYLDSVQKKIANQSGLVLTSLGGFYADVLGLFGPYLPTGYPGPAQPTAQQVVQSFLYNFVGIQAPFNTNPLNWVRQNSNNTSSYQTYFDGLILDFENVGNGNPLNSFPYAPPSNPPAFPAEATNPKYAPYIAVLGNIPSQYYAINPDIFLGNAPVSLSLIADVGTTNICAANSALNTWYAFPTATVPPTVATYNSSSSLALNHPEQMSYMDDIFVQFYNETPDYYPGGQYFANLLACWGWVALEAQKLGRKKTTINLGMAKGNIIPGGSPPYKAAAQGPTPPLDGQSGPPYTYWYPQYATDSPPNATTAAQNTLFWPNTSPAKDPTNVANAIKSANSILQSMTGNNNLVPSDWLSGMGFWAGGNATLMAKAIYDKNNTLSPENIIPGILPHTYVYCWSDASYPAPDPLWPANLPITANY
jgi:hypothetical protein